MRQIRQDNLHPQFWGDLNVIYHSIIERILSVYISFRGRDRGCPTLRNVAASIYVFLKQRNIIIWKEVGCNFSLADRSNADAPAQWKS